MVCATALAARLVAYSLFAIATLSISAKSHDVSPGMKLEDALFVVKRCVIETTAFRDPRAPHQQHKELRAQDTLEFVGITDAERLKTLRRYIVRNTDFGVQSVWGVRLNEPHARPYLIPNSALSNIEKTWTLEKLAREITKLAGLPFMTYRKAAQITANCRYEFKPPAAGAATKGPPVGTNIWTDLPTPGERTGLKICILTSARRGIPSAGIIDGEGDFYPYVVDNNAILRIHAIFNNQYATYQMLISEMHDRAHVDLSKHLTALVLGHSTLLESRGRCANLSFLIETLCSGGTISSTTGSFSRTNISSLGIAPVTIVPAVTKYRHKDKTHAVNFTRLGTLTFDGTAGDLVDDIEAAL